MAILFFEGFNIRNTDGSPYLDSRYWSRPIEDNPRLSLDPDTDEAISEIPTATNDNVIFGGTYRSLVMSGYRMDTIPPQIATPIQLSNVSGLYSDETYISFRVAGFGHNYTLIPYPHTTKFLTLCSGEKELLAFDIVRTTGASVQGGSNWQYPNQGIGISVKQTGINNSMTQIGLFDFRIDGIRNYDIINFTNPFSTVTDYRPTMIVDAQDTSQGTNYVRRYIHLEFFINTLQNRIRMKVDGFDVLNKAGRQPFTPLASGLSPFGVFDNIKFYNKGVINDTYTDTTLDRGNILIDDIAICNNSGDPPNVWMGPNTRIFNLSLAAPDDPTTALQEWTASTNSNSSRLNSNDGDTSYVSSQITGQIYSSRLTFNHGSNAFSGYFTDSDNIGGIRVFNSVRKTFLDSDFVNVYGTGDGSLSDVFLPIGDNYAVDHTNYFIKNSFVFKDPHTNTPWTTGTFFVPYVENINNIDTVKTSGYFGIKKL